MSRRIGWFVLVLAACSGNERGDDGAIARDAGVIGRDAGARDAGARDGGPRIDGGTAACPTAADYVGDATWPGRLVLPNGLELCRYAAQNEPLEEVVARRARMTIASGTYPLPIDAEDLPIFVPMCFAAGGAPALAPGTVDATRQGTIDGPADAYFVTAAMPVTDGTRLELQVALPLADPMRTIDGPVSEYGGVWATHCRTANCFEDATTYTPCDLAPRLCDRFTFEDGDLAIDQFHWAGSVGAGFAAATRARGTFRGTAFDVSAYDQLAIAYGHHAFTRSFLMTFDAPIDGVCGLRMAEVSEFGQIGDVELVDCVGGLLGTSAVTDDSHTFAQPCDG